jgi:hypothetical protein
VALAGLFARAEADPPSSVAPASTLGAAAEQEFAKGRELVKAGKWREACDAFEQSEKLDPESGTLFNIAECDVHIGKLASAWAAYRSLAQRDANSGRRKKSAELAAALEPRLPKLAIHVEPAVPDLALKLDGVDATNLVGIDSPIDLGTFQLEANAPGYKPWSKSVVVSAERDTVRVDIAMARVSPPSEPVAATVPPVVVAPPAQQEQQQQPSSHRKAYAIGTTAVGGALLAGGLVVGGLALSKWDDAKSRDTMDPTTANTLVDEARSRATIADVLVAVGAIGVGVGVYVLVSKSPRETRTALRVIATPTAISLAGGF